MMADVQLLRFDDVPKEVFTRWDITEHKLNQRLLNESMAGTPEIVADVLTSRPDSSTTCTGIRTPT
jgi:hypothetical protein